MPVAASMLVVVAAAAPQVEAQPGRGAPTPCEPGPSVICGQRGPEDVLALGSQWVVAGAYAGTGGFDLIRVADRVPHTAYPAAAAKHEHDRRTYPDCPGPPQAGSFTTHGLYVAPGNGPVHKLFVVGHGARESIEVFNIDTGSATPAVTWIGCVIAPDPIGLNSVRGLPDGGFITTNFLPRDQQMQTMMNGTQNGELWEWHTASGWQKIPGSESSGANGVELSEDGKTLYVAEWGSQSFFRLTRGEATPKRDNVPLGFRIDNIHWAKDGTLLGVGQAGQNWKVVKIDPRTLEVRDVLTQPNAPGGFGNGTGAVEVGDKLWVGSFTGNRIAIVDMP